MFFSEPGLQVVHADHPVIAREQVIAQVRAQEPGAAGDHGSRHRREATGRTRARAGRAGPRPAAPGRTRPRPPAWPPGGQPRDRPAPAGGGQPTSCTRPARVTAASRGGRGSSDACTMRATTPSSGSSLDTPSRLRPAAAVVSWMGVLDHGRVDARHRHVRAVLGAHTVGVGHQPALGHGVGRRQRQAQERHPRGHEHHPPARTHQLVDGGGRDVPGSEQVDLDHLAGALVRRRPGGRGPAQAGVVDQHVEPAQLGHRLARPPARRPRGR